MALVVKKPSGKDYVLNPAQEAFVKARVSGMNCVQAAQAAGYAFPKVKGYQTEAHPAIQAALKKEWAKAEKVSEMSKKKVMDGMLYAIDQAKLLADPSAQIAGWREVAKICGYYEPQKVKLEVSVSAKRMFSQFETLSDAELLKIAETEIIDVESTVIEDNEQATDDNSAA
jgi:phage terminase small subunit